ncbi:MAG: stage II sporulation protein M [Solirubrobacteraceae bacterium]|nr:stage II sporulation protein M [Solirubrobacteraceae bacterium]
MAFRPRSDDLILVQGLRGTRAVFDDWSARPWRVLGPWLAGSAAITATLLVSVIVIAHVVTPDPNPPMVLPGFGQNAGADGVAWYLWRNGLVLALHAMACVAGFIAGSTLPLEAEKYSGWWRWVHDKAGPLAILFVTAATLFSLITQAWSLGFGLSTLSFQFDVSPQYLLMLLLPHAIPELIALFLPLAAWIIASRRGEWDQLLAATFVTVGIAVPMLIAAALTEVYVTPILLRHALHLT